MFFVVFHFSFDSDSGFDLQQVAAIAIVWILAEMLQLYPIESQEFSQIASLSGDEICLHLCWQTIGFGCVASQEEKAEMSSI